MSLNTHNTEQNIEIVRLSFRIAEFVEECLKELNAYHQSIEFYLLHGVPLIVENRIHRMKDIIYINVTYKKVNIKSMQTINLEVLNEMVIVSTHFNVKFLEDEEKVDTFINKLYLKLDEWVHLLLDKIDTDAFDILHCDPTRINNYNDLFNTESMYKVTTLASYEHVKIDNGLIEEILHSIFNAVQDGSEFEQYRIHFSNLSLTSDTMYTDFTILITTVQYDKVGHSVYFMFDIVNEDEDRKKDGMDKFKGSYGIPLLASNPSRQLKCIFCLSENTVLYVGNFVENFSKNMVEVIELLSESCFVEEIVVERKEIQNV